MSCDFGNAGKCSSRPYHQLYAGCHLDRLLSSQAMAEQSPSNSSRVTVNLSGILQSCQSSQPFSSGYLECPVDFLKTSRNLSSVLSPRVAFSHQQASGRRLIISLSVCTYRGGNHFQALETKRLSDYRSRKMRDMPFKFKNLTLSPCIYLLLSVGLLLIVYPTRAFSIHRPRAQIDDASH